MRGCKIKAISKLSNFQNISTISQSVWSWWWSTSIFLSYLGFVVFTKYLKSGYCNAQFKLKMYCLELLEMRIEIEGLELEL